MRIAIAGYGVEGRASYKYWLDKGNSVTILDESPTAKLPVGVDSTQGPQVFDDLSAYDLVVRTAGLRPDKLKNAQKIWSATNEFFANCPAPIIGVTGTKGKGTTASLIASILKTAGYTVHLVGNIGQPALDVLREIKPSDVVVYELSSFQLWDMEKSPQIAVVLMIEPDHLDVHRSIDEYVVAKTNITRFQTTDDIVIYHPTNPFSKQIAFAGSGRKIRYGVAEDGGVYVKSDKFFVQNNPICSVGTLQVVGQHNIENACAAITAALSYDKNISKQSIEKGLADFGGLPHRLKFVAEVDGVEYYDDSIATTPGSAIAAIKSFDEPKIIILGGSEKGATYDEIVDLCAQTDTKIVAIGQTGQKIHELARGADVEVYRVDGLMDKVIEKVAEIARPGSVVVLSPASASFDQYANYADRGNQFINAVSAL